MRAGSCRAWPLTPDETCAREARRIFRRAVDGLALEPGVFDDALTMTSELAANTLHASEAARAMAADEQPGSAELWLYLRGVGVTRELVCKVFDGYRGWLNGPPPDDFPGEPCGDERGRGLRIVAELSAGRWGYHPTCGRLSAWRTPGKAVWFAVPAPMAHPRLPDVTGLRVYTSSVDVSADRNQARISPRRAARELAQMLTERGYGGSAFARSDEPDGDVSVLAFRHGMTLWCRPGSVTLTAPGPRWERWAYTDLIEAAEHAVRTYEELAAERSRELVTA